MKAMASLGRYPELGLEGPRICAPKERKESDERKPLPKVLRDRNKSTKRLHHPPPTNNNDHD